MAQYSPTGDMRSTTRDTIPKEWGWYPIENNLAWHDAILPMPPPPPPHCRRVSMAGTRSLWVFLESPPPPVHTSCMLMIPWMTTSIILVDIMVRPIPLHHVCPMPRVVLLRLPVWHQVYHSLVRV